MYKKTDADCKKELNLTDDEFNQGIKSLIEKGLVEEVIVNDEVLYKLTSNGKIVGKHMMSDPKTKN